MGVRIQVDEAELSRLLAAGYSDGRAATALGVSASTVRRRRLELGLSRGKAAPRKAAELRSSSFLVRCTPSELSELDARARAASTRRADLVRSLLWGETRKPMSPPAPKPPRETLRQRRERHRKGIPLPVIDEPQISEPSPGDFEPEFRAAFGRLRRERRVNLVPISSMRDALPYYSRAAFDSALYELRRGREFVLESYDGRHSKPKPAELEGGITEGGRLFVYVSRRED